MKIINIIGGDMFKKITVLLAISTLMGCASVDEAMRDYYKKEREADMSRARTHCESYGFKEGAVNYPECIQKEMLSTTEDREKRKAASWEDARKSIDKMEATRRSMIPVHTDCNSYGSSISCTSR